MGGAGQARNKPSAFSISVFGRFTYTLSALIVHCLIGLWDVVFWGRQCSLRADSVCVNSRTLDIGKGGGLISRLTLGDGRLWVGGV